MSALLITGGTGSIGSFLVKELIKNKVDKEIILFDLNPNYKRIKEISNQVKVVCGDVSIWSDLVDIVKKYEIDEIFHLAAILSSDSEQSPLQSMRVNIKGTINVLETAKLFNINKVIFPSTISTYGLNAVEPVNENQIQQPTNIYGVTKVLDELWGLYYYNKYRIDFRSVRFPRIVNPGRTGSGAALFPSELIEKVALEEPYKLEVEKDYKIPILYIKDAVKSLMLLYEAKEVKTRIYNLSALVPTAEEIVKILEKYKPNAKIEFVSQSFSSHLQIPLKFNSDKIHKELEWEIEYDTDKMVKDFIEYVCNK